MKKPDENLIKLYELGYINEIKVFYSNGGGTFVTLTGFTGKTLEWTGEEAQKYRHYLDLSFGYNSIAELCHTDKLEVREWKEFVGKNKQEFDEYNRLKKKFSQDDKTTEALE